MVKSVRTNADDADFRSLVVLLDKDLKIRDGDAHSFFAQFNKIDTLGHVVVAYHSGTAVGCGGFKFYNAAQAEIKRMFVLPEFRGRGIAGIVLSELEKWAGELNFQECVLETGTKQPEAIRLYQKAGYERIPNYGQYAAVDTSVCMKKAIRRAISAG